MDSDWVDCWVGWRVVEKVVPRVALTVAHLVDKRVHASAENLVGGSVDGLVVPMALGSAEHWVASSAFEKADQKAA